MSDSLSPFKSIFPQRKRRTTKGTPNAPSKEDLGLVSLRFHVSIPTSRNSARSSSLSIAHIIAEKYVPGACLPPADIGLNTNLSRGAADHIAFANNETSLCDQMQYTPPSKPTQTEQLDLPDAGVHVKYGIRDGRDGAAGATILMLHGAGTTHRAFDSIAARLSVRARCRIVCPDLRGHGGSATPLDDETAYDPRKIVDDLAALVLALDLYTSPLLVVGHAKLGGDAALGLAAKMPRLVGALFLLEYAADGIPRDVATFVPTQAAIFPNHRAAFDTLGSDALQWRFRTRAAGAGEVPSRTRPAKGILRQTLASVRDAGAGAVEIAMDPRFFYRGLDRDGVIRLLESLPESIALCCCIGAESAYTSDACARKTLMAASQVRRKKLEILPKCGHLALFDDALPVYTALKSFLAKSWRNLVVDAGRAAERTPERLGLRDLEQFESMEAARKALGPRRLPTLEEIEAAYALISADDEAPDDDDDEEARTRLTALTQNDAEYFGFVG